MEAWSKSCEQATFQQLITRMTAGEQEAAKMRRIRRMSTLNPVTPRMVKIQPDMHASSLNEEEDVRM
eukprot:6183744-Pleurochrysis_carterae.AAC.1